MRDLYIWGNCACSAVAPFLVLYEDREGVRDMLKARSLKKNDMGLSERHEAYCLARAQGKDPADAYLETVAQKPGLSRNNASIMACKLERLDAIKARLQMLQEQAEEQALMKTAQIQAKLTEIATDDSQPAAVQLKALDQLAKMQGAYNEKVEVRATITMSDKEEAARRLLEASFGLVPPLDVTDVVHDATTPDAS